MISLTYVFLELLMLIVLYRAGITLKRNYRILSHAGISAIVAYTFVLGMRFGRGIDYNVYWNLYEDVSKGLEFDKSIMFYFLIKFLVFLNFPYQILVLIMSFAFILGMLMLLKNFKEVAPCALPIFAILSQSYVENMVRWYFAYSIFLIGLSYLIKDGRINKYFITYSLLGISIHYAFTPVPILFYILFKFRGPVLHPYLSIPIFLSIYFFFNTEFMSSFVNTIQSMSFLFGSAYEGYADNAEYWLTGGFSGLEKSGHIGVSVLVFLLFIVYFGYETVRFKGHNYVFVYNIALLGLFLYPISLLIELVERYDMTFFFFRAIVIASILGFSKYVWKKKHQYISFFVLVCLLWTNIYVFTSPFHGSEKYFMFIWNHTNETSGYMINAWENRAYEINKNNQKNN